MRFSYPDYFTYASIYVDFGPNGPDWNCFLTLQLLLSIEIDPTAKLQILVKNLEKILKIKTQKVVFIVQKTQRAKTTLYFI